MVPSRQAESRAPVPGSLHKGTGGGPPHGQPIGNKDRHYYAAIIRESWQKSVDGIFETANHLVQAELELGREDFQQLWQENLGWSKGTVNKLQAIAQSKQLADRHAVSHVKLPVSWGTLYELAKLDDGKWAAIEPELRSDLTRRELKQLLRANRTKEREDVALSTESSDDSCVLHVCQVGNLAECVAEESIDAIITDPPYGKDAIDSYTDLAHFAKYALKPGRPCLVMTGQAHLPAFIDRLTSALQYNWTLAYLTPGQSTQSFGRKVKSNWKPVLWFTKGKNTSEHVADTITSAGRDTSWHEWGQDAEAFAELVERFTVRGETVCDPFLGGGTTAVVARRLERRFIGCDVDEIAVEQTKKRLK